MSSTTPATPLSVRSYVEELSLPEMGFRYDDGIMTKFHVNTYQFYCDTPEERFVVTTIVVSRLVQPVIIVTSSLSKIQVIDDDSIDMTTRRLILLGYLKDLGFKPAVALLRVHKIDYISSQED